MMIEKIAHRLVVDTPKNMLDHGIGVASSLPELRNDLLNIRTRIANFGRGQVTAELTRQMSHAA